MNLHTRLKRLEARAITRTDAVVCVWLEVPERGDLVMRGFFGRPEPCADVQAVLDEAHGQGFTPKIYRGIDPDWL
ncbi:MAG TPA: hypothetical protein VEL76_02555 [Gemmataceae bacterium]|nr:hypothetical protein [Gemmataceae bacterium]